MRKEMFEKMSTSGCVHCLAIGLFIFLVSYTSACESQEPAEVIGENQCLEKLPFCFRCRCPVNVTIWAKNILKEPFFNVTANVLIKRQPLQIFLEQAASIEPRFNRFKTTYYYNKDMALGYFIDSINGTAGSVENKTFWQISGGGVPLQCGVSTYLPKNNEVVLFNFTTYRDAGYE